MATIRIGTFNCENLFARYKFNKTIDPQKAVIDGWRTDQRHFDISDATSKKLTAQAILALDANVLALQEVENLDTLKRFRDLYLGGRKAYPYVVSIDGNDRRLIDVAVLSRYPLVNINTTSTSGCLPGSPSSSPGTAWRWMSSCQANASPSTSTTSSR